jgi:hypothetical protein
MSLMSDFVPIYFSFYLAIHRKVSLLEMTSKEVEIAMALYTSIFQKLTLHPVQVDKGFTLKHTNSKRRLTWAALSLFLNVNLLFLCPIGLLILYAILYGLQSIPFPTWILGFQFFLGVFGSGTVLANLAAYYFGGIAVPLWNHLITLQGRNTNTN